MCTFFMQVKYSPCIARIFEYNGGDEELNRLFGLFVRSTARFLLPVLHSFSPIIL